MNAAGSRLKSLIWYRKVWTKCKIAWYFQNRKFTKIVLLRKKLQMVSNYNLFQNIAWSSCTREDTFYSFFNSTHTFNYTYDEQLKTCNLSLIIRYVHNRQSKRSHGKRMNNNNNYNNNLQQRDACHKLIVQFSFEVWFVCWLYDLVFVWWHVVCNINLGLRH